MPTGLVTLTVKFEIEAESVREAEKALNIWLRDAEDDDRLVEYVVDATEWETLES